MSFCEHMYSFSLGIYLGLEWLGSSVGICLALVETVKQFSEVDMSHHTAIQWVYGSTS